MLPLVIAAAHAYTISCGSELIPHQALPAAGGVGPADLRPAVVFSDNGCEPTGSAWNVRLLDEGGAEVATTLGEGSDDVNATWLIELFPDVPLTVGAPYTIEIEKEAEIAFTSTFTPADSSIQGIDGAPTLVVDGLWWDNGAGELSAGVTLTPAADPDALSVLQVRDTFVDRGIQTFVAPTEGPLSADLAWSDSRKPAEACLQVRQIDGAGNATDWSDEVCDSPRLSCSTSGSGPVFGAALLALGLAAARRRR